MRHVCPICKAATDSELHKDFPFCSERCRILDLGAWSSEAYVISDPVFDEAEIEQSHLERELQQDPNETIH
ncbi:MAG TPA: DNA gyrase inhibitor YacG [Dongiaceae bacterium]|nr:DNA gyrase inhibitor YacG [Dongiaceae bacterium]